MPTFPILRHEPDIRSFKQGETIFKRETRPTACSRWSKAPSKFTSGASWWKTSRPAACSARWPSSMDSPAARLLWVRIYGSVAAISEKRFLRLVELTPRFALQMMQVITERLRRNNPR